MAWHRYNLPEHYKTLKVQDGSSVDPDTMTFMMETMAGFCQDTLAPLNEVGDQVCSCPELPLLVVLVAVLAVGTMVVLLAPLLLLVVALVGHCRGPHYCRVGNGKCETLNVN